MAILAPPPSFRFYGRRKGRPLRARKTELVEKLLPILKIQTPQAPQDCIDPFALFSFRPQHIWLEIGFGGGEHLAAQALTNPHTGFIGCEPYFNGIAGLCDTIDKKGISNIRVFPDDARLFLDTLPANSVDRCFLLFPDPWPKSRHAERRFINPDNCTRLSRILHVGSQLRLATDDRPLADWMRACLTERTDFRLLSDSFIFPQDWTSTRYEQKALKAGRKPVYMIWERI